MFMPNYKLPEQPSTKGLEYLIKILWQVLSNYLVPILGVEMVETEYGSLNACLG